MTIEEYAKKTGFYPIKYIGDWNGKKVYKPKLQNENNDVLLCIGYPLVIFEEKGMFRVSTPDESLDVSEYFSDDKDD